MSVATLFDKLWDAHVVRVIEDGWALLHIDRHLLHEGSAAAFTRFEKRGIRVRRPDLCFATADHYVLTSPGSPAPDDEVRGMVEALARNTKSQGVV